jgi:hypothetical protein
MNDDYRFVWSTLPNRADDKFATKGSKAPAILQLLVNECSDVIGEMRLHELFCVLEAGNLEHARESADSR